MTNGYMVLKDSTIKVFGTKDEWLKERQKHITATDIAAICGCSEYLTASDIYHLKTAEEVIQQEETDNMKLGLLEQPALTQYFGWKSNKNVLELDPYHLVKYKDDNVISATLDALTDDSEVVEIKTSQHHWKEIPASYILQVQTQLYCTNFNKGYLVAREAGEVNIYEIERDNSLIEQIVNRAHDFAAAVERRQPPKPTTSKDMLKALEKYEPKSLTLSRDGLAVYGELIKLRQTLKLMTQKKELIEKKFIELMYQKEATDIIDSNGNTLIKLVKVKDSTTMDIAKVKEFLKDNIKDFLKPKAGYSYLKVVEPEKEESDE